MPAASTLRPEPSALDEHRDRARRVGIGRAISAARPGVVLTAAWLVLVLYAYPGILPSTTFDALEQARSWVPLGPPSPVMALLWRALEWVATGPAPLLAVQSGLMLAGVYGLARSRLAPRAAAWTTLATLACPPVLATFAVLAPHTLGTALLAAGGAASLSTRRWHKLVGAVTVALGIAVAPGLALVALPLALALWRAPARADSPAPASPPAARAGVARHVAWSLGAWALAASLGLAAARLATPAPPPAEPAAVAAPPRPISLGERLERLWPEAKVAVPARHYIPARQLNLSIRNRWSPAQRGISSALGGLARTTPLFWPALYLALALAAVARRSRDRLVVGLTGAALAAAALALASDGAPTAALAPALAAAVLAVAIAMVSARQHASVAPPALEPSWHLAPALRRLARDPRCVLVVGWLGFMIYAHPGYMSYDSVMQVREARSGDFSDWHPPVMAQVWRVIDFVIAGPFGMLVLQSTAFLAGAHGIARRFVSRYAAAVLAALLLWFPPVASVLAVIWKDSQMAGFLMLGASLLLSPRRAVRLWGLVALCLATAYRHNALTITLPLIGLLFVWSPRFTGWRRYAIAAAAWLLVTFSARVGSSLIVDRHFDLWHDSLALYDIAGTLHFMAPMSDDELRRQLAGTPLVPPHDLQRAARLEAPDDLFVSLGKSTWALFRAPTNDAERAAIGTAWRNIVLGNPLAFLQYRLAAAKVILQMAGTEGFPIYMWFTDIGQPLESSLRTQHSASRSSVQAWLQHRMVKAGRSVAVRVYLYALLAVLLLPLCLRERTLGALVLSGISGEAALLVFSPASDTRYSMWMVLTAAFAAVLLAARRAGARPAEP